MLTDESSLPRPILLDSILPHLDLRSLVRFSGVSKQCKDAVFRQMAGAHWSKVDFTGNQILTDDQLHTFLDNINARDNMKVLSLVGCANIRGMGLEPLRGSRVLEDIDLRVLGSLPLTGERGKLSGPSGLDEGTVSDILQSLSGPETALRRVAIRPRKSSRMRMRILDDSEEIRQFITGHSRFFTDVPGCPFQCWLCYAQYPESKEDVFCEKCSEEYCKACAMPFTCTDCKNDFCQWCRAEQKCAECNKQSCVGCANGGYEWCDSCRKIYCEDCKDQELERCVTARWYGIERKYCAWCV